MRETPPLSDSRLLTKQDALPQCVHLVFVNKSRPLPAALHSWWGWRGGRGDVLGTVGELRRARAFNQY
jgi:hypothetical protein